MTWHLGEPTKEMHMHCLCGGHQCSAIILVYTREEIELVPVYLPREHEVQLQDAADHDREQAHDRKDEETSGW